MFDQKVFIQFILENNVVGFFDEPVKLKSGRTSNWYVNWRTVAQDVFLSEQLSNFIIEFTKSKNLSPEVFYGVPEGATKLGLLTSYLWAKSQRDYTAGKFPFSMGRAKPKEHGAVKDKFFLGEPKGKVVVLEDVTTTGGSLLNTIEALSQIDCEIVAAVGLTNRSELRDDGKSVAQVLQERNISYYAMSEAFDFLPVVIKHVAPSSKIISAIQEELTNYGVKELKL